jgi:hypothetical protein
MTKRVCDRCGKDIQLKIGEDAILYDGDLRIKERDIVVRVIVKAQYTYTGYTYTGIVDLKDVHICKKCLREFVKQGVDANESSE